MIKHRGGCHCGRVKYEIIAPSRIKVNQCNCSICSKSGYLGLLVPKERFKLLCGEEYLTTYTFNTGVAKHLFCSHCGIKSFYVPRSHPDGYNVNARCLDPTTIENMEIIPVDGQNWEKRYPKGRANSYPE
jgi:hypothetical protein